VKSELGILLAWADLGWTLLTVDAMKEAPVADRIAGSTGQATARAATTAAHAII
jgi:hypothetical protein